MPSSLFSYTDSYIPTKEQIRAVNKLIDRLPTDIKEEFFRLWKGTNKITGHSLFSYLKGKTLLPHQAKALSFLDAFFVAEGSKAYQEFELRYCHSEGDSFISSTQFVQITGKPIYPEQLSKLNGALGRLTDVSLLVVSHFLAQVLHETGNLQFITEIASGAAYEFRKDLGNTTAGDGKKYKGAGGLQLTGKYNYVEFAKWVDDPEVITEGCKYVAKTYFWDSAVWYWNLRKISQHALKDSLEDVTLRINGGDNGIGSRRVYLDRVKKVLFR